MNLSNKARICIIILMVITMLIGAAIAVYPIFAAAYAERVRSEIHTQYDGAVVNSNAEQLSKLRKEAEEWNHNLFSGKISPLEPDTNGYYDTLSLSNTEIIGFIRIPSIDVELPIYHSIADDVLANGVGHMPQSSLPVGGINCHAVLSAHSGLSSSPMFSNLELVEVGDIFYIDILGETLAYRVYEIPEPVLPADITSVQIQRGRDLCTLITCTPYGINTHRLLVHGERIEYKPATEDASPTAPAIEEPQDDIWMENYLGSLYLGVWICVLLLVVTVTAIIIIRCRTATSANKQFEPPES